MPSVQCPFSSVLNETYVCAVNAKRQENDSSWSMLSVGCEMCGPLVGTVLIPLQERDRLHVRGMRKHINCLHLDQPIPSVCQHPNVSLLCRQVARHVNYRPRPCSHTTRVGLGCIVYLLTGMAHRS